MNWIEYEQYGGSICQKIEEIINVFKISEKLLETNEYSSNSSAQPIFDATQNANKVTNYDKRS
jgi:hypothetical protein